MHHLINEGSETMSNASVLSDFPVNAIASLEKMTGNFACADICHDEYYKKFLAENQYQVVNDYN